MSVEDNLQLGAFRIAKAIAAQSFERVYTLFPRLKERRKQLAGTLSGGEQQMLAMGRALMGAPKLLMLDEPSLGLAPIIVADIFRTIGELRAAGVSVLLVEQNAQAALQIADRAYVMELGEFILSGPAERYRQQPARGCELSGIPARGRERDLERRVGKGVITGLSVIHHLSSRTLRRGWARHRPRARPAACAHPTTFTAPERTSRPSPSAGCGRGRRGRSDPFR